MMNTNILFNINILLFFIGLYGFLYTRRNFIIMLMSIELMLLAVNLNFILFSVYLDDIVGQIFALVILTVAAAEAAVGLAIIVAYYRLRKIISIEYLQLIKNYKI